MEKQNDIYDLEFYKSLTGEQALKERLSGRLPMTEIMGQPFFIDVRLNQLRPKDHFHTMGIELTENKFDENTKVYYVYYHHPSMTEVEVHRNIVQLPEDVVLIKIPEKRKLDSVAMARIEGKELDERYLKKYPVNMYIALKAVPIEKTFVKKVVSSNLAYMHKQVKELYQSYSPEEAIKGRIQQGRRPIIDLHGHNYIVDISRDMLRPDDPSRGHPILLDEQKFDKSTKSYHILFDVDRSMEVSASGKKYPKGTVLLEVPEKMKLDSVAMAVLHGKKPDAYLREYPLQMYTELKGIPVEKKTLEQSAKSSEKVQGSAAEKKTKTPRRRKGRGL